MLEKNPDGTLVYRGLPQATKDALRAMTAPEKLNRQDLYAEAETVLKRHLAITAEIVRRVNVGFEQGDAQS